MSTYVCSDIHGQYKLFQKMMEDVTPEDTVYVLGDIIDRGPDSIRLMNYIIDQPNIISILGNHELMMYDYYHHGSQKNIWVMSCNGGTITRRAYNKEKKLQRNKIMEYIENMYLQIEIEVEKKKFLLSHSFFVNTGTLKWKDVDHETVFDCVWYSPWRNWEYVPMSFYDDGRIHVIGHVPTQTFYHETPPKAFINEEGSIINIDLGCARMQSKTKEWKGLCRMCLEDYVNGNDAFQYY